MSGFNLNNVSRAGFMAVVAGDPRLPKAGRIQYLSSTVAVLPETTDGLGDWTGGKPSDPANAFLIECVDGAPRGGWGSWSFAVPVVGQTERGLNFGIVPLEEQQYDTVENVLRLRPIVRRLDADYIPRPRTDSQGERKPLWLESNRGGYMPHDAEGVMVGTTRHGQSVFGQTGPEHEGPQLVVSASGGPLVADQATGRYSPHVFEITEEGTLDRQRAGPLQTIFWTKLLARGAGISRTRESPGVVALNLTGAGGIGAGDGATRGFGYGMFASTVLAPIAAPQGPTITGPGRPRPIDPGTGQIGSQGTGQTAARVTLPPLVMGRPDPWARYNPGGARGVPVNAYLSHIFNGPISPGHAQSRHRLGVNDDNEALNPGVIDCNAYYTLTQPGNEEREGPRDFEQVNEPDVVLDGGVPHRVHEQWDHDSNHVQHHGGFRGRTQLTETHTGRWRMHVKLPVAGKPEPIPIVPITGGQPPDFPPSPPNFPPPGSPPPGGPAPGEEDVPYLVPGQQGFTVGPPSDRPIDQAMLWTGGYKPVNVQANGMVFVPAALDPFAPAWERVAAPGVGRMTSLYRVETDRLRGRPVYTTNPLIRNKPLDLAGALRDVDPGTADGLVVFGPPEIRPMRGEAHHSYAPGDRPISSSTLLLTRSKLGWGYAGDDNASVVGWESAYNVATGNLDFANYDNAGAADPTQRITDNGEYLPRVWSGSGAPSLDDLDGVIAGDLYWRTDTNKIYTCEDPTVPTWIQIGSGSGGGTVDTVVGTTDRITVDATDPANPIVDIAAAYDTERDGYADSVGAAAVASANSYTDGEISSLASVVSAHIGDTGNPHGVTKAQVGLGSVENTALSTWTGSTNIATVGTISSGTWNGATVAVGHGGTGRTTLSAGGLVKGAGGSAVGSLDAAAAGDIIYASAANTWAILTASTNGHVLTLAAGVPSWAAPQTLKTTSTSSTTVGLGSKTVTTAAALSVGIGTVLRIARDSPDQATFMEGPVTAIAGTSVTIDSQLIGGSGTHTDWEVYVAGGVVSTAYTNLVPDADSTRSLGSSSVWWLTGWIDKVNQQDFVAWDVSTVKYYAGNVVFYEHGVTGKEYYVCIAENTSGASNGPVVGSAGPAAWRRLENPNRYYYWEPGSAESPTILDYASGTQFDLNNVSGGDVVLTLPTTAGTNVRAGDHWVFHATSVGGFTIDLGGVITLDADGEAVTLKFDGAEWYVESGYGVG